MQQGSLRGRRRPRLMRLACLVPAFAALALSASVLGASCTPIAGPFNSTLEAGPPCASVILLCTDGHLGGDLDGSYAFEMNSLAPALAPAHPTMLVFTGASHITTALGEMEGSDVGRMEYTAAGPTPFTTIVELVSGSGAYAGVSGTIVAKGHLDFAAQTAVGAYTGALCFQA